MGFVSKRGFSPATNFVLKIHAVLVSDNWTLKGNCFCFMIIRNILHVPYVRL